MCTCKYFIVLTCYFYMYTSNNIYHHDYYVTNTLLTLYIYIYIYIMKHIFILYYLLIYLINKCTCKYFIVLT